MERRFDIRKREMEQDAKIDKKDLAGALRRLDTFFIPVHGISAQKERNGRRRRDVESEDHLEASGGNRLGGERP